MNEGIRILVSVNDRNRLQSIGFLDIWERNSMSEHTRQKYTSDNENSSFQPWLYCCVSSVVVQKITISVEFSQ